MARCLQDLGLSTSASEALDLYKEKYPAQSTNLSVKNLEKDIRTSTGRQQQQTSAKAASETTPPSTATDAPSEATVENAEENEEPRPRIVWENEEEPFEEDSSGGYSIRSRSISVPETRWRTNAWDYDQRFCGHCNTTTDFKEANFFGRSNTFIIFSFTHLTLLLFVYSDGQYIVAGSDDGCIFIWDRTTGVIQRILKGDDSIVNCLQPHPTTCLMATSGIDSVVRLWAPLPSVRVSFLLLI
jgi:WD and tetratricopeptide repeat-containing protein 1